jgi:CO dehydrogenase nickel-insertion accessory protein CooC1
LSTTQQQVYDHIVNLTGGNIYICGRAGVGKSFVVRRALEHLERQGVAVWRYVARDGLDALWTDGAAHVLVIDDDGFDEAAIEDVQRRAIEPATDAGLMVVYITQRALCEHDPLADLFRVQVVLNQFSIE